MAMPDRTSVTDFYEQEVLPALAGRLDVAFPEFGWRRDDRGWRAGNEDFTHATLGARADRVVCHGEAPRGFLVHGQGPVLWTTYVNDGRLARGRDFVEAVRRLAERAGVEAGRIDRPPTPSERKASLLHDAFGACRSELVSERGVAARDYLERRGIPLDRIAESGLGLMPAADRLRLALIGAGYRDSEIGASGLLADQRWPGRIVGAWRDEHSRVVTLWSRTIDDAEHERYLYLRGAPRVGAIPYGLADLAPKARAEVTLVEGVIDVHVLRAHDVHAVAALGGTSIGRGVFERLGDQGVERVILALDNDDAGRAAVAKAVDSSVRAARSPDVWVVDPDLLSAKDPADVVRVGGADAWRRASAAPVCGVSWRALDLTGPTTLVEQIARRAGLARAGAWLGTLPERLSVEQTAAVEVVADSLGYDPASVRRAFHARYWRRERAPDAARAPGIGR